MTNPTTTIQMEPTPADILRVMLQPELLEVANLCVAAREGRNVALHALWWQQVMSANPNRCVACPTEPGAVLTERELRKQLAHDWSYQQVAECHGVNEKDLRLAVRVLKHQQRSV